MSLDGVEASLWLNLSDVAGAIVSQTQAPATRATLAVMVTGPVGVPLTVVSLQAGVGGAEACRIKAVHVGYRIEELEETFGRIDRVAILALLEQRLATLVLGLAQDEAVPVQKVDYRAPGNVFRHSKADGPFGKGAFRTLSMGRVGWDYVVKVRVAAGSPGRSLCVRLADVAETFTLFLVDNGFEAVCSERMKVLSGKRAVEAWLKLPSEGGWLIFQAGPAPDDGTVVLESIAVVG